jgi:hypothetical protein
VNNNNNNNNNNNSDMLENNFIGKYPTHHEACHYAVLPFSGALCFLVRKKIVVSQFSQIRASYMVPFG